MKSFTAKEIAEMLKGTIKGDDSVVITGVSSLKEATPSHVSFLGNKKYHPQLAPSKAGVVLLSKDLENEELPNNKTYIICNNVDLAFSDVIALFAPPHLFLNVQSTRQQSLTRPQSSAIMFISAPMQSLTKMPQSETEVPSAQELTSVRKQKSAVIL